MLREFCSEWLISKCRICGLGGVTEREAEKQRLLSHNSELNFEKDALEQRAADLGAALVASITTSQYQFTFFMAFPREEGHVLQNMLA